MVSGYKNKFADRTKNEYITGLRMQIVEEMRSVADKEIIRNLFPSFDEFAKWLSKHVGSGTDILSLKYRFFAYLKLGYLVPIEYSGLLSDEMWHLIDATTKFRGIDDGKIHPRVLDFDKDTIEKLNEIYRTDFSLMNYSNFTYPDFPSLLPPWPGR